MSASSSPMKHGSSGTVKRLLQQFKGMELLPGVDTLRLALVRLCGLQEVLDNNYVEYTDLVARLEILTNGIMKRSRAGEATGAKQDDELVALAKVVDDISSLTERVQEAGLARNAAVAEEHSRQLARYNKLLDNIYSELQLRVAMDIRNTLQGLQVSRETSRPHLVIPKGTPIVELPPKPTFVYGRDQRLNSALDTLLRLPSAHIAVLGAGGMGKTTFAVTLLHHEAVVAEFGRHRIFVSCDGLTSADAIITGMLSALGVLATEGLTHLQSLVAYLHSLQPRVFLVLDNLETAWDTPQREAVETLLTNLCNIPTLALMITMRGARTPNGQRWIAFPPLEKLSLDDSRALFIDISALQDDKLDELLGYLDGLPLAVTLMASLGASTIGYTPSKLLHLYRTEHTSMLETGMKTRLSSLDVSMTLSICGRTMQENPVALELLKLLSLLPDGVRDEDLESIFPQLGRREAAVRILYAVALATYVEGSTRVLAPIRAFMQEKYPPAGTHLLAMQHHYIKLASSSREYPDISKTLTETLSSQMGNLLSVLTYGLRNSLEQLALLDALLDVAWFSSRSYAGDCTLVLRAIMSLKPIHNRATAAQGESSFHKANDALESLAVPDDGCAPSISEAEGQRHSYDLDRRHRIARAAFVLAVTLEKRQQYPEAQKLLNEVKTEYADLGQRVGVAECLQSLGNILRIQDKYEQATVLLQEAKPMFADIGNKRGVADCLWSLSDMLKMRYDYEQATRLLNEAKTTYADVGDRRGVAQCLQDLGEILKMQSEYKQAKGLANEGKESYVDIANRKGVSDHLYSAANIQRQQRQHEYDLATALLNEAKATYADIGDRKGVADCLLKLSIIVKLQNKYGQATVLVSEADATYVEIGDRKGVADCLLNLYSLLRLQGAEEQAADVLNQAKATYAEIGTRMGVADCLWSVGNILRLQAEYEKAAGLFIEAKATYEDVGNRMAVASCLWSLGDILRLRREYDQATELLNESKTIFEGADSQNDIAWCARTLGQTHQARGNLDEAGVLFAEARTLFERIGLSDEAEWCQKDLEGLPELRKRQEQEKELPNEFPTPKENQVEHFQVETHIRKQEQEPLQDDSHIPEEEQGQNLLDKTETHPSSKEQDQQPRDESHTVRQEDEHRLQDEPRSGARRGKGHVSVPKWLRIPGLGHQRRQS